MQCFTNFLVVNNVIIIIFKAQTFCVHFVSCALKVFAAHVSTKYFGYIPQTGFAVDEMDPITLLPKEAS